MIEEPRRGASCLPLSGRSRLETIDTTRTRWEFISENPLDEHFNGIRLGKRKGNSKISPFLEFHLTSESQGGEKFYFRSRAKVSVLGLASDVRDLKFIIFPHPKSGLLVSCAVNYSMSLKAPQSGIWCFVIVSLGSDKINSSHALIIPHGSECSAWAFADVIHERLQTSSGGLGRHRKVFPSWEWKEENSATSVLLLEDDDAKGLTFDVFISL